MGEPAKWGEREDAWFETTEAEPGWYPPITLDEEGLPTMAPAKGGRPTEGRTRLQAAFEIRGLTHEEAAQMTGVSVTTIGAVCRGKQVPHPGLIFRLRKVLGGSFEDLFDWEAYDASLEAEVSARRAAWKRRKQRKPNKKTGK